MTDLDQNPELLMQIPNPVNMFVLFLFIPQWSLGSVTCMHFCLVNLFGIVKELVNFSLYTAIVFEWNTLIFFWIWLPLCWKPFLPLVLCCSDIPASFLSFQSLAVIKRVYLGYEHLDLPISNLQAESFHPFVQRPGLQIQLQAVWRWWSEFSRFSQSSGWDEERKERRAAFVPVVNESSVLS